MIDQLFKRELRYQRLVYNVWRVQSGQHTGCLKVEKKVFLMTQDTDPQSFQSRWMDMAWAIEMLDAVTRPAAVHVAARAIPHREAQHAWRGILALPQSMKEWGDAADRGNYPMQITDFVPSLASFNDAEAGTARGLALKGMLRNLLSKPNAVKELGRGLTADLFLGNNDRIARDNAGWYINRDNFFFREVWHGHPPAILYIDAWDPNSVDNSLKHFDNPSDTYLGEALGSKSVRRQVSDQLQQTFNSRFGITLNVSWFEAGIAEGAKLIAAHLAGTRNRAIRRRADACKIKIK